MTRARKSLSTTPKLVLVMLFGCFAATAGNAFAQVLARVDGGKQRIAILIEPSAVTKENASLWRKDGFDAVVLILDERFEPAVYETAAEMIAANSAELYYWI